MDSQTLDGRGDLSGDSSTEGDLDPQQERQSCRFCGFMLKDTFVDLGMSPLCESFINVHELNRMERFYPLHVQVCSNCFLVQVQEYVSPAEIFTTYAYFSSYSDTWLAHAKDYADRRVDQLRLDTNSLVVEIASNDGYLLQYFIQRHIPVLGIEPAANVAAAALRKGVPTLVSFFGRQAALALVADGKRADLLIANNVLAHVPDLNGFVAGMKILLSPRGVITAEFPHLMCLMAERQFDTIYHEHFSYFSFSTAERILAANGLTCFDVEELSTHGGSLRIYARHSDDTSKPVSARVDDLRAREMKAGLARLDSYTSFGEHAQEAKRELLTFLIDVKRSGKRVAAYGAPGKGNTLLNYCGIRTDFVDYAVDRNPYKQGKFLPGTHIPIYHPDRIKQTRPDYLLILPWNLKNEIIRQNIFIREWGGRFVVPIPSVKVY
jgi:hypothetical protein